jgi:hypothetical protein
MNRLIKVCATCLIVDANGDGELPEDELREWGGFLPDHDRSMWAHATHSDDLDETEPCEGHFSWSACEGCGSGLGGDRYCVVSMPR